MTSEHLRPLLQSEKDMTLFWQIAQDLARAAVPDVIVVRLGRLRRRRAGRSSDGHVVRFGATSSPPLSPISASTG